MNAVVIRSATEVEGFTAPVQDGGVPFRYEMIVPDSGIRVYADTATDLVDVLIPGYENLPLTDRYAARLRYMIARQVTLQIELNSSFLPLSKWATEAEQEVLLGSRHVPPAVDDWNSAVPLALVDAFYEPLGELPRPWSGVSSAKDAPNLLWLETTSDDRLLRSLASCGAITFAESLTRSAPRAED